jgi:hypothetical protein
MTPRSRDRIGRGSSLRVRDVRMTVRPGHAFASAVLACGLLFGAGCAKDATTVVVAVDADDTVPPLLILRTIVARADDPTRRASSNRSSPYTAVDASDRPGPFVFPMNLSLTIDAGLAGAVTITIEGLDWDTSAVIARGTGDAVAIAQGTTQASLTMTATPPAPPTDASADTSAATSAATD